MKTIKDAYPFTILALVELQKHLHAIWSFPKIGQIIYVNHASDRLYLSYNH
ncbi:hypothetical protein NTGBS_650014 [Candidatus Nitrotoga sp. BS]|nr:hypothetical protein NTGBS_650014 [Candidatus Nitrotoga sp. BS]